MNVLNNTVSRGDRSPPMHQGKWTSEEEDYVKCLIAAFKAGVVPIPDGTTLRIFLSRMLNCPPKRISKKFVGTNYNGKQVYVRKGEDEVDSETVNEYHKKLRDLEQKFLKSLSPIIDFQAISKEKEGKAHESTDITAPSSLPLPSQRVVDPLVAAAAASYQGMTHKRPSSLPNSSAGGQDSLNDVLKQASYRQIMQARALQDHFIQERLRTNLLAQESLRQRAAGLLHQTHQGNTQTSISNEFLLGFLNQKAVPASSATKQVNGVPTPEQQYHLDTDKRQADYSALNSSSSKRARQA